jgi:hypothetical protein
MKRRILRLRARPLFAVLRALGKTGTRLPSLGVGVYRVSLDTSNRRLYAKCLDRYLGEITVSGIYRPGTDARPLDIESVKLLVERTLDVARGSAILLGLKARCALCGRLLDSKDRLRGIGAKCYEKAECWRLEPKSKK